MITKLSIWKTREELYANGPVFTLPYKGNCDQCVIYTNNLFNKLTNQKMLSDKYDFMICVQISEEQTSFFDEYRNKFSSLKNCFEHELLFEHKKRDFVSIHIPDYCSLNKFEMEDFFRQIRIKKGQAVFVILSREEIINRISYMMNSMDKVNNDVASTKKVGFYY
ncbi:hypothetical protein P261_00102 [Lachnospiraceae bacterium TWA4]|nr:hypothetical protein P261_00102 [Lachnospiraceae bacterium TWA4]